MEKDVKRGMDMCGIMGYVGDRQAAPILLEGLGRLAYRGYDSAGMVVSVAEERGWRLQVAKTNGKIDALDRLTKGGQRLLGTCGLGHTRWATHGAPLERNAHPHVSMDGRVAVVHNGIIENHQTLRRILEREGYVFVSDTDTEVIAHLLSRAYAKQDKNNPHGVALAIFEVVSVLQGSYALGILVEDEGDVLYGICHQSPLCVGASPTGQYMASDKIAMLSMATSAGEVAEDTLLCLSRGEMTFYQMRDGELADVTLTQPSLTALTMACDPVSKQGYPHYMLKEIYEQPQAIRDTLAECVNSERVDLQVLADVEEVAFFGCGSAYHVGCVGQVWAEQMAGVPSQAYIASEVGSGRGAVTSPRRRWGIFVSQSGETADTLWALRQVKTLGMTTVGVLNVPTSRMAKEVELVWPTMAGVEVSVATTKAYTAQLVAVLLFCLGLGEAKGRMSTAQVEDLIREIGRVPALLECWLKDTQAVQVLAQKLKFEDHIFLLGRGLDYALAKEGALKLKEVAYIHAEAYPAGELKHGSLSLIEEGRMVLCLATQPALYGKMKSAMAEVRARGGEVVCLTNAQEDLFGDVAHQVITLPVTHPWLAPLVGVLPMQMLAYHTAHSRGLPIDQPRHLAKSVTVQ